uniref:hypothetical protein n=1 Tax=Ramlibacter sp. TaxID=1917967 RepID=UPI003D0EE091
MSVTTDWIYMVEWTARYLGDMRTFRYATRSFRFGPTVDAAWGTPRYESITGATTYEHMYVPGRVSSITIESNMHAPGCTRGELSIDTCTIVLDNEGGGLDKLRAARCAGRIVRIFRINPGDLADFDCIWHGTAAGYLPPGDESITLRGRGFQYLLDRPLLVNRYAGTNAGGNGLEGEAEDLKGKTKPMFMGKRFNFEPPEVNTAKKIFQIDGQIGELQPGATFDVMDAGWPFTPGADYASLADLESTPPAAGEWRLFRGPGGVYFRIGTTPTGAVTVNGENPMSAYTAGSVVAPIAGYVTGCEAQILMVALLRWLQVNELNAAGEVMSIQGLHSLC